MYTAIHFFPSAQTLWSSKWEHNTVGQIIGQDSETEKQRDSETV